MSNFNLYLGLDSNYIKVSIGSMKKLVLFILVSLMWWNVSFSMSLDYENEMYGGCYDSDIIERLGKKRAKQYCTCAIKMVSNKFSDDEIVTLLNNEEYYKLDFASNHCNKYKNAF